MQCQCNGNTNAKVVQCDLHGYRLAHEKIFKKLVGTSSSNFPGGIVTVRSLSLIWFYDTKNAIYSVDGGDESSYGVLYQLYEHVKLD